MEIRIPRWVLWLTGSWLRTLGAVIQLPLEGKGSLSDGSYQALLKFTFMVAVAEDGSEAAPGAPVSAQGERHRTRRTFPRAL